MENKNSWEKAVGYVDGCGGYKFYDIYFKYFKSIDKTLVYDKQFLEEDSLFVLQGKYELPTEEEVNKYVAANREDGSWGPDGDDEDLLVDEIDEDAINYAKWCHFMDFMNENTVLDMRNGMSVVVTEDEEVELGVDNKDRYNAFMEKLKELGFNESDIR